MIQVISIIVLKAAECLLAIEAFDDYESHDILGGTIMLLLLLGVMAYVLFTKPAFYEGHNTLKLILEAVAVLIILDHCKDPS